MRLSAYGHNKIASYGAGNEYDRRQWQAFVRELVQSGFIDVVGGKYPVLKLNHKSSSVLSGKTLVNLTRLQRTKEAEMIKEASHEDVFDHKLFEILRALRKSIADSENMPPYVVFHDSALREMAAFFPQSKHNMKKIKGVGSAKLERYGDKFLEKIADYCRQNGIAERAVAKKLSVPKESDTYRQTLLLIKDLSIEEAARSRGLAPSTIVSHIEKLILSGEQIDINRFIAKEKQETIISTMRNLGTQSLTAVKEALGHDYSYDEIRLARAKLHAKKSEGALA